MRLSAELCVACDAELSKDVTHIFHHKKFHNMPHVLFIDEAEGDSAIVARVWFSSSEYRGMRDSAFLRGGL